MLAFSIMMLGSKGVLPPTDTTNFLVNKKDMESEKMQSQAELKSLLQRIDHRGYPAYKDTKGRYDFGKYMLSIDHVQGDPFASPSKVSVHVKGSMAKFPRELYQMKWECKRSLHIRIL